MKHWCVKCRKQQSLNDSKKTEYNNRPAIKGKCSVCKFEVISYNVEE